MKKEIEIILNFRKYLLTKIEGLSIDDLNYIPEGHSNNIIWNMGHLDAVLQKLCYQHAGLPLTIPTSYFAPFLPGTRPEGFLAPSEAARIREQLITSVARLRDDLENNLFVTYQPVAKIKAVYTIDVASIEDALKYICHHEGMHFNAMMQLKRITSTRMH